MISLQLTVIAGFFEVLPIYRQDRSGSQPSLAESERGSRFFVLRVTSPAEILPRCSRHAEPNPDL